MLGGVTLIYDERVRIRKKKERKKVENVFRCTSWWNIFTNLIIQCERKRLYWVVAQFRASVCERELAAEEKIIFCFWYCPNNLIKNQLKTSDEKDWPKKLVVFSFMTIYEYIFSYQCTPPTSPIKIF